MAERRYLPHAPIREALIDMRVAATRTFDETRIDVLRPRLESYPIVEKQQFFQAEVSWGAATRGPTVAHAFRGYIFKTTDRLTLAQFRVDGFTLNRLKPYSKWEVLLPEALRLWRLYVEVANPDLVTRVAVRYINHLVLAPPGDLSEYLTAPPVRPPEWPNLITGFLTRVTLREPDSDLSVIVTQASEPGLDPSQLTVILDIDAYKEEEYAPNDERLWSTLEALRALKNTIFFGSLTEAAIRRYE